LLGKLKELMKHQKCHVHGGACHEGIFSRNFFVGDRIPLAGVAHQNGTVRFGNDPRTSALKPDCRAHEVDNQYVVGRQLFPLQRGGSTPALTIKANDAAPRGAITIEPAALGVSFAAKCRRPSAPRKNA
jgi:choline dehydrogenase-like flavoprotein